jgi:hypothetical protein
MAPIYLDPSGTPTNRVPDGYEPGWKMNTTPPFTPPGTGS